MEIQRLLEIRLADAVRRAGPGLTGATETIELSTDELLLRPSQNPAFGDYQVNLAMPLGKRFGKPPRQVAEAVVTNLEVADLCEPPEIAGPGFINLRLRTDFLAERLAAMVADERLGVAPAEKPLTIVIDYSSPNCAKPMHVGHIRSTVIGDALYRVLEFLGHRVISDNHIGDWGTQFGMILYGYKHFVRAAGYAENPVGELSRLYRFVRRAIDIQSARQRLDGGEAERKIADAVARLEPLRQAIAAAESDDPKGNAKDRAKEKDRAAKALRRAEAEIESLRARALVAAAKADPELSNAVADHPDLNRRVQLETARLHAGDPENRRLWEEFQPACRDEMDRIYRRLRVTFDHTLGESFYQPMLAGVVDEAICAGVATETDGAVGIFFTPEELPPPASDVPMLIRKKDGAFLYATTDLATIRYRVEQWQPDRILYLTDHRQSLHFQQLFAAVKKLGWPEMDLRHVSFGTVLGEDGKPFKTRSGDTVGLESLLDEAVQRARAVVESTGGAAAPRGEISAEIGKEKEAEMPPAALPGGQREGVASHQELPLHDEKTLPMVAGLSEVESRTIAETVGIAALKYADLSQNRTSDYVFSYDKMLAMNGNTATYMQYAYARVRSIFRKVGMTAESLRGDAAGGVTLTTAAERALALRLLQFEGALERTAAESAPHHLAAYLYELAGAYSGFFENCPVRRAESDELRRSRLRLCDLVARTIEKGLALLGIHVVDRM